MVEYQFSQVSGKGPEGNDLYHEFLDAGVMRKMRMEMQYPKVPKSH